MAQQNKQILTWRTQDQMVTILFEGRVPVLRHDIEQLIAFLHLEVETFPETYEEPEPVQEEGTSDAGY